MRYIILARKGPFSCKLYSFFMLKPYINQPVPTFHVLQDASLKLYQLSMLLFFNLAITDHQRNSQTVFFLQLAMTLNDRNIKEN